LITFVELQRSSTDSFGSCLVWQHTPKHMRERHRDLETQSEKNRWDLHLTNAKFSSSWHWDSMAMAVGSTFLAGIHPSS
jgi:hypothetical protein